MADYEYTFSHVHAERREALSPDFVRHLVTLNSLVQESNDPLEGNLFYENSSERSAKVTSETTSLDAGFYLKRLNYVEATRGKRKIVEIGMNACHSALLAMMAHPKLVYFGIDIGIHVYTRPCAEYMKATFGGRFDFALGDSAKVFPLLAYDLTDCDLIHIDGGHGHDEFIIDFNHALMLPKPASMVRHILVDDTGFPKIRSSIFEYVNRGLVATETFGGWWHGAGNAAILLRVL